MTYYVEEEKLNRAINMIALLSSACLALFLALCGSIWLSRQVFDRGAEVAELTRQHLAITRALRTENAQLRGILLDYRRTDNLRRRGKIS